MLPDSPFTQRRNRPIKVLQEVQVSPGNVEVDFFVNLYKDADGNLTPGAYTYSSKTRAIEAAATSILEPIGTMKYTAILDDEV